VATTPIATKKKAAAAVIFIVKVVRGSGCKRERDVVKEMVKRIWKKVLWMEWPQVCRIGELPFIGKSVLISA